MTRRPNIVFITSHDTGRHLGCYGIPQLETPRLDRFAGEGVLFENFFCTSPVCSASRATMMTGQYPQTNGVMGLIHFPDCWEFRPQTRHLSHILRDLGYRTALVHHQHEVMPDAVESRLGFQEYLARQGTGVPEREFGSHFEGFLNRQSPDQPFYVQMGFGLTHRSWQGDKHTRPDPVERVHVPPWIVDNPAARQDLAWLQGSVRHLDEAIGNVLDALARSSFADDTIVVITTDHGLEVPRAKWTLYDPGIEVACLVRWPNGGIRGGHRARQLLSNVDWTPTLLDLIGAPVPGDLEGRSFAAACRGDTAPVRDEIHAMYVQSVQPEARCVRTATHKIIRTFSNYRLLEVPVDMSLAKPAVRLYPTDMVKDRACCPSLQIYDLVNDPLETENLAGNPAHAAIEQDLDSRLWRWMEATRDPLLEGPLRIPSYRASIDAYHTWNRQAGSRS